MIGQQFGRLTVTGEAPKRSGRPTWLCRCACGVSKVIDQKSLRNGLCKSCGCLSREMSRARCVSRTKHGHTQNGGTCTPTYKSWLAMLTRCFNKNSDRYAAYGAKGITVCERWRTFENFLADMGERQLGTSLDRIDGSKGYEPGNCRWATMAQQLTNRRGYRPVKERPAA